LNVFRNKIVSNSSLNSSNDKRKNCSPAESENVPKSDSAILLVKFIKTKMCNFVSESLVACMLITLELYDRGFGSRSALTGYNREKRI
jgi:hypothetical protein